MIEILGVVKEAPVPKLVPPEELAYQLRIPKFEVAPNTTVPAPQCEAGVVEDITGVALTVAITALRGEVQLLLVAST